MTRIIFKGTSKNPFWLRTAAIAPGGVVVEKPSSRVFRHLLLWFFASALPGTISLVLATKAIFRGPLKV